MTPMTGTVTDVLLSARARTNYTVDPTTDCWHWNGHVDRKTGYGYAWKNGVGGHAFAHRQFYMLHVGPVPEGLVLDHLCRNRGCVNPDHLEPVTQRVNTLRGIGPSAQLAAQTHCKRGHELAGANLYLTPEGWRQCRTCRNECQRRFTAKRPRGRRTVTGAMSNDELLAFVARCWQELGSQPSHLAYTAWAKEHQAPTGTTISKRLGSWSTAVTRARKHTAAPPDEAA